MTSTGAGGSGKMRSAMKTAANVADDFHVGVYFVGFAAHSEPSLVPDTLATALGTQGQSGLALTEAMADDLRDKKVFLLRRSCALKTERAVRYCNGKPDP